MVKSNEGTPLLYNIFKIPLPVSGWNTEDKKSAVSEARRLISQFHISKSVVFCHSSSTEHGNIGIELLDHHKSHSLRLCNIRLSTLCSVPFIKQFLLPYKLRVCSLGDRICDGYRFSLNVDDGLHLQSLLCNDSLKLSNDQFNVVGLSNSSKMHRHKDGYVTVRMEVTSGAYLKDGSKLYKRTITALDRLESCDAVVSSGLGFARESLQSLLLECGSSACTVDVLEGKTSVSKVRVVYTCAEMLQTVGDADCGLLRQDTIISSVKEILDRGKLQDKAEAPVPVTCNAPNEDYNVSDDSAKRRKVLSSSDRDEGLEDFDVFLKHKDLLFKAHRTLSQDKNKKVDTLRNVMRELDAAGLHSYTGGSLIHRLRHAIDDLIFRSIVSSRPSMSAMKPHRKGPEFVVSVSDGSYTPAESLFDMFKSAWFVITI
ncbi:LOW QUALITY PROTEIN: hypothetical protein X943_000347 [Babesia divergens]|uniref:Uncharacterized protein n=1 Tax=Babesia divergens TaxID=32595 RepID=A0AAD9LI16_BABDI|nr:LOW QUALITY PROTEIN: hypothetical protein X943_000347 [Babesia divergens]